MDTKNSIEFTGPAWIGFLPIQARSVNLKIDSENLIIENNFPILTSKTYVFNHQNIEKIQIQKYVLFMSYGIKIIAKRKTVKSIIFWVSDSKYNQLLKALQDYGWLPKNKI